MRPPLLLVAGLLVPVAPALAQVTLDLHALDRGPAQPTNPATEPSKPPPHRPVHPARPAHPAARREAAPGNPTTVNPTAIVKPPAAAVPETPHAVAPPPALPTVPPPAVSLAPIVVPTPQAKLEPPQTPPISADAGGGAEPIANGLRVLFSPSRTDLTVATEAGIKAYLGTVPKTENTSFDVTAYAAGAPEDPSTPRRLSLSRALAIRSVLLADGIVSARIYVRALGAANAGGPSDRVDVVALGTNGAETPK